ncbi:hypothetical protein GCM10027275_00760 [Rhabdobacter roseus]|uniref:Cell fate (Sporulation/competence/biofilm development) regulator YlbF (YheA/YmcA/DUF963 family) n=1 Tax=Rhabdobacter roseus TaxID=1655419 RepID=A0A840TPI1_9BACT|nr:hypothetical protein [Rhabdobacter roseus]MBB5281960.1 cell fate (sporulation/competence/biofilm development) regulator YlbF (YheA/YmcA/DUF963 family) [Rhabdobacter roseus]
MEKNKSTLREALQKLPSYPPPEETWQGTCQKMNELPLREALSQLPTYQPAEVLWESIEAKSASKKRTAWYRVAAAVTVGLLGLGTFYLWPGENSAVAYSVEQVDTRLQPEPDRLIDAEYEKLRAYCEAQSLLCSGDDFQRLQREFEALQRASERLQQAMTPYNTEPALVRQLNQLEREKAQLLNEMATFI